MRLRICVQRECARAEGWRRIVPHRIPKLEKRRDSLLTGPIARPTGHKSTTGGKDKSHRGKATDGHPNKSQGTIWTCESVLKTSVSNVRQTLGAQDYLPRHTLRPKGGNSNQVRLTTTDKTNKNKCPETKMSSVNQVRSFQNQIISFHFNTHPLIDKRITTFVVAFSRSGSQMY